MYASGWLTVLSVAFGVVEVDYRVNDKVRHKMNLSPLWAVCFVVMRASEVAFRISVLVVWAVITWRKGQWMMFALCSVLWLSYTCALKVSEPENVAKDHVVAHGLMAISFFVVNPARFVQKVGYVRARNNVSTVMLFARWIEASVLVATVVAETLQHPGLSFWKDHESAFFQILGCCAVYLVSMPFGWHLEGNRAPPEDAVLELIPHRARRTGRVLRGAPRGLSSYLFNVGTGLTHRMFTQIDEQLSDFLIERTLGTGAYGVVVLVRQRSSRGRELKPADQRSYAMKLQCVSNHGPSEVMQSKKVLAERERDILRKLSHPFIVRLIHYFEVPQRTWVDASSCELIKDRHGCPQHFDKAIVMEYCPEGDLECFILKHSVSATSVTSPPDSLDSDFISSSSHRDWDDSIAWLLRMRRFVAEISVALQFLHAHSVIYRDLKPANTLLKVWDDGELHVCMSDFGGSKETMDGNGPESLAGTLMYAAPEILEIRHSGEKRQYSVAVDNFSFGRMILVMLWRTKFMSDEEELVMPDTEEYQGDHRVPELAAELIRTLTQRNPALRGDLGALCAHSFFSEFAHLHRKCPAIQWGRLTHGAP